MSQRLQREAKERGDMYFYTGKPCAQGHDSPRLTSCYNCAQCHEERQKIRKRDRKPAAIKKPVVKKKSSRTLAKEAGNKTYVSKSCKHGHDSPRFTKNGSCVRCQELRTGTKIRIYKEVRITEEEIQVETFNEMAKRVYKRNQLW